MSKKAEAFKSSSKKFFKLISVFLNRIDRLNNYSQLSQAPIRKLFNSSVTKYKNFLKAKRIDQKDTKKIKNLKGKNKIKVDLLVNDMFKQFDLLQTGQEGSLISLVSQLNTTLYYMVRFAFSEKRELFNTLDKSFTLKEISHFEKVTDAEDFLLEQKINEISRNKEIFFNFINQTFNIKMEELPSFLEIMELIERRNIYVHNDGRINEQYLKLHKSSRVAGALNKKIVFEPVYIRTSFDHARIFLICVAYSIWRRLFKDSLEELDVMFEQTYYKFLKQKNYKIMLSLVDFALDNFVKPEDSTTFKFNLIINKALVNKLVKSKTNWKKLLHEVIWENQEKVYIFAVAVLLDDFNKAVSLMPELDIKSMDEAYHDWPLLEEFRKTKVFNDAYEKIYKKKFEQIKKPVEDSAKLLEKIDLLSLD